jgi:hypothetical protein
VFLGACVAWAPTRCSAKCRRGTRVHHIATLQGRARSPWPWRGHGAAAARSRRGGRASGRGRAAWCGLKVGPFDRAGRERVRAGTRDPSTRHGQQRGGARAKGSVVGSGRSSSARQGRCKKTGPLGRRWRARAQALGFGQGRNTATTLAVLRRSRAAVASGCSEGTGRDDVAPAKKRRDGWS